MIIALGRKGTMLITPYSKHYFKGEDWASYRYDRLRAVFWALSDLRYNGKRKTIAYAFLLLHYRKMKKELNQ